MIALPFSETITNSRHVRVQELHSYFNLAPLKDVRGPNTPPPVASDAKGRSSQRFVMEVVVRNGEQVRRAAAGGRDIYAITAPLVVEAMERIVDGRHSTLGVTTAGATLTRVTSSTHCLLTICKSSESIHYKLAGEAWHPVDAPIATARPEVEIHALSTRQEHPSASAGDRLSAAAHRALDFRNVVIRGSIATTVVFTVRSSRISLRSESDIRAASCPRDG